jgi:hypothetical protein
LGLHLRQFQRHPFAQQCVLGHREAMARRKWQYKVVGVKGLQLAKLVKG